MNKKIVFGVQHNCSHLTHSIELASSCHVCICNLSEMIVLLGTEMIVFLGTTQDVAGAGSLWLSLRGTLDLLHIVAAVTVLTRRGLYWCQHGPRFTCACHSWRWLCVLFALISMTQLGHVEKTKAPYFTGRRRKKQ